MQPAGRRLLDAWAVWWQQVKESGYQPAPFLPGSSKPYLDGIVSSACYRLHTCRLEGMNNKIKLSSAWPWLPGHSLSFSKSDAFPVNRDEPKFLLACGGSS